MAFDTYVNASRSLNFEMEIVDDPMKLSPIVNTRVQGGRQHGRFRVQSGGRNQWKRLLVSSLFNRLVRIGGSVDCMMQSDKFTSP